MGRLVYEKGKSSKFWEGKVEGATLVVRFGRIGTDGQEKRKKLASPAAAKEALLKVTDEKRRKGYVAEKGKGQRPKVVPLADVAMPKEWRAPLFALAKRLGGASLASEVRLAADDPLAYLKKFKKRMDDIHVDSPRRSLAWLALVEGLKPRKKAVELDWKHEADDAAKWVKGLAGAAGRKVMDEVLKDPELADRRTDEALEQCGGALATVGLALVELSKLSDSYVVMVVPARDVATLVALAHKGGRNSINHFSGKKLAAIAKERRSEQAKEEKKQRSANKWTQLAQGNWQKNTDGVLWSLRHYPFPIDEIRAAAPDAPARDRALIAMTLAMHDAPATKVAKATRDPKLCLRALRYLSENLSRPEERLGATAILVQRLRIKPGNGPLQKQVVEACNLFAEPKDADRALGKLPAPARAALARIADAYLKGTKHQSERWNDAYRALRSVGDETSIAAIEASRKYIWAEFAGEEIQEIEDALARIRARA